MDERRAQKTAYGALGESGSEGHHEAAMSSADVQASQKASTHMEGIASGTVCPQLEALIVGLMEVMRKNSVMTQRRTDVLIATILLSCIKQFVALR